MPTSPSKRALVIGINYFGTSDELGGCVNDAATMAAILRGKSYAVTVLCDRPSDPKWTRADAPTGANIRRAMMHLIAATHPGDTLYIHYSGHGMQTRDTSGDEEDGLDEGICPVDVDTNGCIWDDELNRILVLGIADGARLRVIFDCCHSGTALDLPFMWRSGIDGCMNRVGASTAPASKDVILLSGCDDPETAADTTFAGKSAGAMTRSVALALADMHSGGKFSWRDLCDTSRLWLRKNSYTQVPQLTTSRASDIDAAVDI